MENKKVLFITFDMSGYYTGVYDELKSRYSTVDFYNTATISYKYKNFFEKVYSFVYKIFTGRKLKNYYKYQSLINEVKDNSYDIILIVRPDLFFDAQLTSLKKATNYFVAYYHDSINNIKRKSEVIHFFDKVYSYEKADVENYNLEFLSNFIYFSEISNNYNQTNEVAFSVMSKDYRLNTLKKVAQFFRQNKLDYDFYVIDKQDINDGLITFFSKRMNNETVVEHIKKSKIIVDIHKYGIQDGLTFRAFEAIGYRKKLITTNKDIKNYDFYNSNNIHVIDDVKNISIPLSFFETNYEEIPIELVEKYIVKNWVTTILAQ